MARPIVTLFPTKQFRKCFYGKKPTLLICPVCRAVFVRFNGTRGCSEACRLVLHFERFTEKTDGCWWWHGHQTNNGYGIMRAKKDGKVHSAHRWSYEQYVGPIPDGMTIDHLCRNRICVNPAHMEVVTREENVRRGQSPTAQNARKEQCSRGHNFDAVNTYWTSTGKRACKTCRRMHIRQYQKRRLLALAEGMREDGDDYSP